MGSGARAGLDAARDWAVEHQPASDDLVALHRANIAHEPVNDDLGDVPPKRAESNGIVWFDGGRVHEWGPTGMVDSCMSVTKSFLSALCGVAWRRGLIADVDDEVAGYLHGVEPVLPGLESVTWRSLLQQTSGWAGTLWGKPHWASKVGNAERRAPATKHGAGTGRVWAYNDVRVNVLAYALTALFGENLDTVLRREVMDRLGATATWRWEGYRNSWLTTQRRRLLSVSGGGHWGGGLHMSSDDLLAFGLLYLHGGVHGTEQVVPSAWVDASVAPSRERSDYGYLWWLNTNQTYSTLGSPRCFMALGGGSASGGNVVWVDTDRHLVVVVRWLMYDALATFLDRVYAGIATA